MGPSLGWSVGWGWGSLLELGLGLGTFMELGSILGMGTRMGADGILLLVLRTLVSVMSVRLTTIAIMAT